MAENLAYIGYTMTLVSRGWGSRHVEEEKAYEADGGEEAQ